MSNPPGIGLEAWEARRKAWTTPNQHYLDNEVQIKARGERCKDLIQHEAQRLAIYKSLVLHRESFRTPIGLQNIVCSKILFFLFAIELRYIN